MDNREYNVKLCRSYSQFNTRRRRRVEKMGHTVFQTTSKIHMLPLKNYVVRLGSHYLCVCCNTTETQRFVKADGRSADKGIRHRLWQRKLKCRIHTTFGHLYCHKT